MRLSGETSLGQVEVKILAVLVPKEREGESSCRGWDWLFRWISSSEKSSQPFDFTSHRGFSPLMVATCWADRIFFLLFFDLQRFFSTFKNINLSFKHAFLWFYELLRFIQWVYDTSSGRNTYPGTVHCLTSTTRFLEEILGARELLFPPLFLRRSSQIIFHSRFFFKYSLASWQGNVSKSRRLDKEVPRSRA